MITPVSRTERWLNVLVYGEYGVGKTRLAGSSALVPEMNDVLFLNVEAGDLSLAEFPNILKVDVNRYSTLARAYEFLRMHCQLRDSNAPPEKLLEHQSRYFPPEVLQGKPKVFRTVILDTLTEVAKYVMYQLLSVDVGAKRLDVEPESPEFKEWNQSTEMVRLLIRSLRDLPMHVILVCSQKEEEVRPGLMKAGLNLSKALAKEIPGFLDVVGYMTSGITEQQTIERRLFLESGRNWMAKHRFGQLQQSFLINPEMKDLLALLKRHS
jgi:hypothetical protein